MIGVCWNPPPLGFIKINSNRSSLGNPGVDGYGGLLRQDNGEWIMGFSGHVPRVNNLCVKLLALQR